MRRGPPEPRAGQTVHCAKMPRLSASQWNSIVRSLQLGYGGSLFRKTARNYAASKIQRSFRRFRRRKNPGPFRRFRRGEKVGAYRKEFKNYKYLMGKRVARYQKYRRQYKRASALRKRGVLPRTYRVKYPRRK